VDEQQRQEASAISTEPKRSDHSAKLIAKEMTVLLNMEFSRFRHISCGIVEIDSDSGF